MPEIQTGQDLKEYLASEQIAVAVAAKRLGISERSMYDQLNKPQLPPQILSKIDQGALLYDPYDPDAEFILPKQTKLHLLVRKKNEVSDYLNKQLQENITEANHVFIIDGSEGDVIASDSRTKPEIVTGSLKKYIHDRSLVDFLRKHRETHFLLVTNYDSRVMIHRMDEEGDFYLIVRTDAHDNYRLRAVEKLCQKLIFELIGFAASEAASL